MFLFELLDEKEKKVARHRPAYMYNDTSISENIHIVWNYNNIIWLLDG